MHGPYPLGASGGLGLVAPPRGLGRGQRCGPALGQTAEAVDSVPLLAARVRDAGVDAPVLGSLAGLIEGRVEPARFTSSLTAPKKKKAKAARAA